MDVSDIHVKTTECLLQLIYILRWKENCQHSMSANPDYVKISIENYKQEIFPTFMFALCIYVICSLNQLYLEVIFNINVSFSQGKNHFYENINSKEYWQQIW